MTTNQRYGGLNRRFEARGQLLAQFGFRYRVIFTDGECTTAVFERKQFRTWGRPQAVSAGTVMHADKLAWADTLASMLRR